MAPAGWEISMQAFFAIFHIFLPLVYSFLHKFVWEPGAFCFSAGKLPLVLPLISQPGHQVTVIEQHCICSRQSVFDISQYNIFFTQFMMTYNHNYINFYFLFVSAYKTVSGVNGPLVILDNVKVSTHYNSYECCEAYEKSPYLKYGILVNFI